MHKTENIKISKDAIYATGKRKESIARVWILKGDGKITINGKKYNEYFKRPVHQLLKVFFQPAFLCRVKKSPDRKQAAKHPELKALLNSTLK